MQGFPKNINNRNDLDHVKVLFPEDTKKYLNNTLVNRKIWSYVGDLEKEEDGVVDDAHKVMSNEDSINGTTTYSQYELVDNLDLIKHLDFNSYVELEEYLWTF